MRADPDFTSYVVARWVPVVRVLVLLGQPPASAEDLAVASFARMLPDWSRLRREGDVDVELARVVLDGWVRARSRQPAPQVPVPVPAGRLLTQELEDQLALLARLTDGLDRLDENTRVTVVLHHLGELDTDQVAEVLGEPRREVQRRLSEAALALGLVPLDPACHTAAAAIDVSPASVPRVLARARAGRRRQWWMAAVAVLAVAAAAAVAYAVTLPEPSAAPDALEVTPVENPVNVSWWVGGTLHMAHGTVRVPDVAQLVDTGIGVAYANDEGVVTTVTEEGVRQRVGTLAPGTPLLAQPSLRLISWLEPEGGKVVVYDVTRGRETEDVDRAVDARLIGWDRERLYLHQEGVDQTLALGPGNTLVDSRVAPPEGGFGSVLLDVASGAELRLDSGVLSVVQPFFNVSRQVPGASGQLSRDGNYVLTHSGDGHPAAYDARSGDPQGTWFSDGTWTPVAAAWTEAGRVVWVVDSHDGRSYGMYECQPSKDWVDSFDPGSSPCTQRVDVDSLPVLAGTQPGLAAGG